MTRIGSNAKTIADLVILNRGQMTRTTPEPELPLQTIMPHQREDVPSLRMFLCTTSSIDGGSSVESITRSKPNQ
ncbi:unnamed protein product [Larinioides sclopetarius]|uniref:Uncharacterized protein n=1 Tax=Larinioides sclopetarius TaxID=280406 RepID=A0AAV1Z569_9ARAC